MYLVLYARTVTRLALAGERNGALGMVCGKANLDYLYYMEKADAN